jgi:hypothetical protein
LHAKLTHHCFLPEAFLGLRKVQTCEGLQSRLGKLWRTRFLVLGWKPEKRQDDTRQVLEASSSILKVRQGTLDALCILPGLGDTQRGVHDADIEEDAGALEEEVRDGDGHLGGQHPWEG